MTALPITSIIKWERDGVVCEPTEHNRSELTVDYERIGSSDRMANARMRKYYVADKRTWSVSWDMLPAPTEKTVDGKAGGSEMEDFYLNTRGSFMLSISHADSNLDQQVEVTFSGFDKTHERRGAYDFWNLSVTMEEV